MDIMRWANRASKLEKVWYKTIKGNKNNLTEKKLKQIMWWRPTENIKKRDQKYLGFVA